MPHHAKGMTIEDGKAIVHGTRRMSMLSTQRPAGMGFPNLSTTAAEPDTPLDEGMTDILEYWRYRLMLKEEGIDLHSRMGKVKHMMDPSVKLALSRRLTLARSIIDATIGSYHRDKLKRYFKDRWETAGPKEVWDKLLTEFKEITNAKKAEILLELLSNKLQKGENPAVFVDRVHQLADKAELAGVWYVSVSEIYPFFVLKAIESELPKIYDKLDLEESLDLSTITDHLDRAKYKKRPHNPGSESALFGDEKEDEKQRKQKPRRDPNKRCSFCNFRSHTADDCKLHPDAPKFNKEFAIAWIKRAMHPSKLKEDLSKKLKDAGVNWSLYANTDSDDDVDLEHQCFSGDEDECGESSAEHSFTGRLNSMNGK
eukprot:TRINITY_DN20656_c0_g1_i3.p1 TRINITY_DN20656_c0_g1~~TRINITY_DN20656_c0_g1_i3.p1  ORF type:complete len:370 (+),score=81.40 TRINITY_DN20656_c0_g1_i3:329-1438(+)